MKGLCILGINRIGDVSHLWFRNISIRPMCLTDEKNSMRKLEGVLVLFLSPLSVSENHLLLVTPRWDRTRTETPCLGAFPTPYPTYLVWPDLGVSFAIQCYIKGLLRKPPTDPVLPPPTYWVASWLTDYRGCRGSLLFCWIRGLLAFEIGLFFADFPQAFVSEAKASKASNIWSSS